MALKYAILAVLAGGPRHGYAIRRDLHRLLAGIWHVNQGQVYATLERLAREDLVALARSPAPSPAKAGGRRGTARGRGREAGPAPADLRPFALSLAGRRRLQRWLEAPLACALPRSDLAAKLALQAWSGDGAGMRRLLGEHRTRCESLLGVLRATAGGGDDLPRLAARRHVETELAWIALAERTACERAAEHEVEP